MGKFHTWSQEHAVRNMGSPGQWTAAGQYGSAAWIDTETFRRIIFLPHAGELDADMTVAVYEADDAAGTGAQVVDNVNLVGTFHNGADETLPGIIEVLSGDLEKQFVNILVTPGATDGFSCVVILCEGHDQPEVNTVGTHVAFNSRVT